MNIWTLVDSFAERWPCTTPLLRRVSGLSQILGALFGEPVFHRKVRENQNYSSQRVEFQDRSSFHMTFGHSFALNGALSFGYLQSPPVWGVFGGPLNLLELAYVLDFVWNHLRDSTGIASSLALWTTFFKPYLRISVFLMCASSRAWHPPFSGPLLN